MKTRLQNLTLLLFISLTLLSFVGCTTKEEKMLEGRWSGQLVETDDDGDRVRYRLRLNFNRESDLMKMELRVGFADGDDLAKITVEGDYMADDESITFFADEESIRYKFSSETKRYAAMGGINTSDFEEMLEATLRERLSITDIPIYSLSEKKLVIDFEGSRLTLYKQ